MLIVSFVCAAFHDKNGTVIHTIRPEDLQVISEAPDAIRQDPLFDMLVKDGTLRVPETKSEVKKLENDPVPKAQETVENVSSAAPAEEKKPGRKSAENK